MIELMFLKVLMLIRQFYQESVLFAIIVFLGFLDKSCPQWVLWSINDVFENKDLNDVYDIAFVNNHGVDYRCVINAINKSEAVNLLQNTDLSKKVEQCKIPVFFNVYKRCIK